MGKITDLGCATLRRAPAILSASWLLAASAASTQVVYTGPGTYRDLGGGTTLGPGGSTQQSVGGTTFVQPGFRGGQIPQTGSTYQTVGGTTIGSDGTTYHQLGDTAIGSDGTTIRTIGDTTIIERPNGQQVTCRRIGTQLDCD